MNSLDADDVLNAVAQRFGSVVRCRECGSEFGAFDPFIPVFQMRLDGGGVEPAGFACIWHFKRSGDLD